MRLFSKPYWIMLVFPIFSVLMPSCAKADDIQVEIIRKFNGTLLDAMKRADELGFSGRYRLLDHVIRDSFALEFMAEQSAGRYWEKLSEEQRDLYLKTYTEWTVATYAGRFDGYSGERFEVASGPEPVPGTVTVISKLIQKKGEDIDFYYLLRRVGDKWRIVDIRILGVSQLALTRGQFTSIIKSKGFGSLIKMLKEKTDAYSQGKIK